MFFEIGVRAATKIPKGVVFGSLPPRLIKSQNSKSLDDEKIGFVEVSHKNDSLRNNIIRIHIETQTHAEVVNHEPVWT